MSHDHDPDIETPDGVSITSIEELRAYIHNAHDTSVSNDDPVLIVHTINGVHLNAIEQTLRRHNAALTQALTIAVKGLTADAITQNLQEQVRLADRTHQEFERQYERAKRLSIMSIIASTVSILCVAICLLVFFYLYTN